MTQRKSLIRTPYACLAIVVILAVVTATPSWAALLDDFESYDTGSINGQGGWSASSSVKLVYDTTDSNQLMELTGGNSNVYKPLGGLSIGNGQTGTLFFRFQVNSNSVNHGLGLSDVASPSDWGDYEATALALPDGSNIKLQGRNGGGYQDLSLNGGAGGLAIDTWYHTWMVVDNATDTADFHIQGGGISTQTQVADGFAFRNGTSDSLNTFLARIGSSPTGSLFIDDIHLSSGVDLSSPIGAPSSGTVVVETPPRNEIGLNTPALYDFAATRLAATHQSMPANRMPGITAENGTTWSQIDQNSWISGFFSGELWMMYRQTGDTSWRDAAKLRTAAMSGSENDGGDHDIGFRVFNSYGQGIASLPDSDPDKAAYKGKVLTAASTLSTRYRTTYNAIESWSGDRVIIDNMMNLEMMFWAAENGASDATELYNRAVNHATTTMNEHVRADGSTYHVVTFDPTSGDVVSKSTHQGYAAESTWSRGQAWGLYGFAMTYRFTNDQDFLDTAKSLADYWLANMPVDGLAPWDFDAPGTSVPLDTSATAIAASALLELCTQVDPADAQRYFDAAETMLESLSGLDALTNEMDYDSILREGSIRPGEHHRGLIYGDYYFIEALQRYDAIPEPATMSLLAIGGIALIRRRRRA